MIILSGKPGRLGNCLFVYAHLMAFAKEYRFSFINISFDDYAAYFSSTKHSWFQKYVFWVGHFVMKCILKFRLSNSWIRAIRIEYDERIELSSKEFLDVAQKTSILLLSGWQLRATDLVQKYADDIRTLFKPKPHYFSHINSFILNAKKDTEILIGVHIRYGDYRHAWGGSHFFELEEYRAVMLNVKALFSNQQVKFVICSNEKIDLSVFDPLDYIMAPGHELEDMYILSNCDYIFGPHSSYSLWASFYGQKPLYVLRDSKLKISLNHFMISNIND